MLTGDLFLVDLRTSQLQDVILACSFLFLDEYNTPKKEYFSTTVYQDASE